MPAWIVPALAGAASLIGGIISRRGAARQSEENWRIAQFQAQANERYLQQQLDYNTPKSQMARYADAGLNPFLVYGQGNPGNQNAPLQAPERKPADFQGSSNALAMALQQIAPLVNQSMMTQSQVQATDAKTRQTYVLTQLNQLQRAVLARNPLLNDTSYNAIIQGLVSSAEIKGADASMKKETADWFTGQKSFNVDGVELHGPAGVLKLETELKLLEQKFDLGSSDQKIKAQVLQSKEFQNAILEIQKKWMTDAEITPQHIYQFIQLLLMKLL